jgi:hypothetical protein
MVHPFTERALQMRFTQRYHIIERLSPNGPNHTFAKSIGGGACAGDFNTSRRQLWTSSSKPAENVWCRSCGRNLQSWISGESFAQLLQRPLLSRMFGRVEMTQPSRSDLQRHEHIKYAKAGGHHGEEIASYDGFGGGVQRGGPALVARSACVTSLIICEYWRLCGN